MLLDRIAISLTVVCGCAQTIRDKKDENWWQVTVSGVQGTVPASMVEVIREEEKLTHLTQLNAGGCVSSAIRRRWPLAVC